MTLTKRTDLRDEQGAPVFFGANERPDVQSTTLSKDLMGRYVCNTLEEVVPDESQPLDYDVVVLGAGMYGGYCAAKIHQFTKDKDRFGEPRILVLDAGPFLLPEHGQNIPDIGAGVPSPEVDTFGEAAQRAREVVWGIGLRSNQPYKGTAYCVGGKSLFWGGWCPRLQAHDLEQWPADVRHFLTQRPFVDPLFGSVETAGAYGAIEYEIGVKPADDFIFDPMREDPAKSAGVGLNAGLRALFQRAVGRINGTVDFTLADPVDAPIGVQTQSYLSGLFSLDKYSSLPGLIAARRAESSQPDFQARLHIVPNAHVVRLLLPSVERDGQQLPGACVTGIRLSYRGRFVDLKLRPTTMVVLAMAEHESARVALESFPIAHTRHRGELMGANLLNHLRRDIVVQMTREQFNALFQQATGETDELVRRPQAAALHVQGSSEEGSFHFQVTSAVNVHDNPDTIYRMVPDLDAARMLAEQGATSGAMVNIALRGVGELRGKRDGTIVTAPEENWGNLAYEDQNDPAFGHRRLYTHYRDESNNPIWGTMDEAFRRLTEELGATLHSDTGQQGLGTTWHEEGMLWMGDDPYGSVTDVNGRFHHVGNVACVDQSIFPTSGSANPVLTGLCLSWKAAEAIANRFRSTAPPPPAVPQLPAGVRSLWPGEKGRWKRSFDQQPLQANRDYYETSRFSVINVDRALSPPDQLPVVFFDEPVENFRLSLMWMSFLLDGDVTANSGVVLRSARPGVSLDEAFYQRAIEVQIDETGYDFSSDPRGFASPLHRTGAVYGIAPARRWAAKLPFTPMAPRDGAWNTYVIEVRDARIQVWLNDALVSETDSLPAELQGPGYIGLQYHTGVTHFGDIRLQRI